MKTFKEFTDTLRQEIWPSGEPRTLRATHTKSFMAALTDLQKNIPCVQQYNFSTYPKCARYWEDAASVVDMPNGVIRRVFTIANDSWRDKVYIWPSNYYQVQRWQKRLFEAVTPANLGMSELPQGFKFDDGTVDSTIGRARVGIWAVHRRRIYVAPWLQSNETLVVEWDGIKDIWADTDGLDDNWWTIDYQETIKLYVRWQHEQNYGEIGLGRAFKAEYEQKRGDLMLACQEKLAQQQQREIPESIGFLTSDEIEDDEAPDAEGGFVNCLIGDWGDDNANTDAVIAQILGQSPSLILTLGDNVYGSSGAEALFAKFGTSIPVKPCWGNHDWDYGSGDLSELKDMFELANNERYYEVLSGPIHYFILDTDPREPDGGYADELTSTQASIMGVWLKVKLALSTAKWKVVIIHHPPYTSDVNYTPGAKWMRWPYRTWGADIVIGGHAHNFEHIQVSGLDYINCGIGGKSLRAFGADTTGTILKQYNDNYGFLKVQADCSALTAKLIDKDGTEVYSAALTKK